MSYWTFTTELAPAKQAMTLVLAIPDDSPIKEQVMENCAEDDLKKATGVKDCYLKFLGHVFEKCIRPWLLGRTNLQDWRLSKNCKRYTQHVECKATHLYRR